jgi:alkanesulfonate monooxygenase SsuD/methylene tetrahydromethanopterin reductase-like flavin-dependent oxidoreductase (luciferase family)
VVAAFPVAVDDDSDRARTAAATAFARYGTLPNYQRLFAREGVDGPADLAVHGDEQAVRARIIEYFDAGASDVWAIPFETGSGTGATIALLKDLVSS